MAGFPLDTRLEGDAADEVAYFVYPEAGRRRVYLINTDWTTAGNVKHCRVTTPTGTAEVDVREGEVAEVVL